MSNFKGGNGGTERMKDLHSVYCISFFQIVFSSGQVVPHAFILCSIGFNFLYSI